MTAGAGIGYNEGSLLTTRGPVAQLGARLNGIQEVTSSILVRSTNSKLVYSGHMGNSHSEHIGNTFGPNG